MGYKLLADYVLDEIVDADQHLLNLASIKQSWEFSASRYKARYELYASAPPPYDRYKQGAWNLWKLYEARIALLEPFIVNLPDLKIGSHHQCHEYDIRLAR
jgi:hypothetical protein